MPDTIIIQLVQDRGNGVMAPAGIHEYGLATDARAGINLAWRYGQGVIARSDHAKTLLAAMTLELDEREPERVAYRTEHGIVTCDDCAYQDDAAARVLPIELAEYHAAYDAPLRCDRCDQSLETRAGNAA